MNKPINTQAYFDDIQLHILHEIRKAVKSIHIAVAWFTDIDIFDLLCQKAQSGIRVELIIFNDGINRNSSVQYDKLTELGGLFLMVGNNKKGSSIMHNKFCVIDGTTVITGSYNWSKRAQENWENITIITDHPILSQQFLQEFETILEYAAGKGASGVDYSKIITRLEALRNVIDLNDDDDITLQLAKLKKLLPESSEFEEVHSIIELIEAGRGEEAASLIATHVNARKQVVIYSDPELPELKLELNAIELQISTLEDERADLEKILHAYRYRYNLELGDLVSRILKLRAEKLEKEAETEQEKKQESEEARQDYESFQHGYQETKDDLMYSVSKAELEEMKSIFRACSKICHPDVVKEKDRQAASDIFKKLNEANEKNDLSAIKEIYEDLKNGIFTTMSASINDARKLHHQVVRMRGKLKDLAVSISNLRRSDTWQKVDAIEDWDEYFVRISQQLRLELAKLEVN